MSLKSKGSINTATCACNDVHSERYCLAQQGLISEEIAARLSNIFKSLSDPTRLRIISVLMTGEICVKGLVAALGISQSAISHQLRDMRAAQLVRTRRDGRHIFYRLADEHVRDVYSQALAHVQHD